MIKTPQDCCKQQFLGWRMIWIWIYGMGKQRRNLHYVIYYLFTCVFLPIYTTCTCVGSLLWSGTWHIPRSFTAPPIWNPLVNFFFARCKTHLFTTGLWFYLYEPIVWYHAVLCEFFSTGTCWSPDSPARWLTQNTSSVRCLMGLHLELSHTLSAILERTHIR